MKEAEAGRRVTDAETRLRALEARAAGLEASAAAMGAIRPVFLEILAVVLLGTALFVGWQIGAALLRLLFWLSSSEVMPGSW